MVTREFHETRAIAHAHGHTRPNSIWYYNGIIKVCGFHLTVTHKWVILTDSFLLNNVQSLVFFSDIFVT